MRLTRRAVSVTVAIAAMLLPASLLASDMILIHGHIYTGNPKAPWAQALAITGTKIDAVGTDQADTK